MSASIIAAVPLSTRLVIWFEDGVSKSYGMADLGVSEEGALQTAHVAGTGYGIEWDDGSVTPAEDLYDRGEAANFVEEEKRRILKSLSEIRREASFSQTKLGEAAGIRQSVISRIEGCEISPQINTLLKLLAPLGKTLAIVDLEER